MMLARLRLWAPLVLVSLASLVAGGAVAETRDYHFQRLGAEHGLAQSTVTAMVQDAQGFVWVGTQGGLHRYDGQRYHVFRHDPHDPDSLPDSHVTALALEPGDAEGPDRALWVGSYAQYVARLDLDSGRVRRFKATDAAGGRVAALLVHAGKVWIGTASGLEVMDPATGGRRVVVPLSAPPAQSAPMRQALRVDADGAVWFASGAGLHRIGRRGGIERIGPALPARDLAFDQAGRLWVAALGGLFRVQDDGRGLIRAWPDPGDEEWGRADVRAVVESPDHGIWLAVAGNGLRRHDPRSGRTEAIRETPWLEAGLPENSIEVLLAERGGTLWAGGQFRGVAVTDPRGAPFRYLYDAGAGTPHPSLVDNSLRSLHEDARGTWWLGTDGGRLLRRAPDDAGFTDVTAGLTALFPATEPSALPLRAMAFLPARDDLVWLATSRGLLRLDTRSGAIAGVPVPELAGIGVRSLDRDRRGDLWLGTFRDGLIRYRPRDGQLRRYHGASRRPVYSVEIDRRGRVWSGTGDGLDLLDPATDRTRHFHHDPDAADSLAGNLVRRIFEAEDGTLWVAGHSGLSRVRETGDGRIRFDHPLAEALAGAPVPVVYDLVEAPRGTLWLGTDRGVFRFEPGPGRVRSFGMESGVQDLEFNSGAALRLRDGRVLMGGVRGLNLFRPGDLRDRADAAPLRLLSAQADGGSGGRLPWRVATLDVPADSGLLRLRIGVLDYAGARGIRYRYRLDGFDADWIDNGENPEIVYTRVPPGHYTFRAQASNRDGEWLPQELRLPVQVAAPPWRHPLAIAAYVVLGAGLLALLAWQLFDRRRRERDYVAQLREREERLKLALWASGEQFWDYDLEQDQLYSLRSLEKRDTDDFDVRSELERRHEIHPEDLPRVRERLRQHLRGESSLFLSEHRIRGEHGGWTWVRARGRVVDRNPATGRARRVAGTARDISASRHAERERRVASEVLRSMSEAVAVCDRDFQFVSVNPAFTRITGYSDAEVIGRPTSLLDSSQHDPEFYRGMRDELERHGRWSGEMWQQRKDGDEFLCWIETTVVLDNSAQRGHYVTVLTDITDKKRAEQELRYLANYDTLTSLPNRALLSERLSRAIVRARRQDSRIAVLFLDLDRFKDVNDSLGHAVGDRILRAAAGRLQQVVGAQHTVARLGGDEFTVVLENIDDASDAEKVAREIITAFEAPLDVDDHLDVSITPSIGISIYPDNAQVPTDLLKHADTAMYQAKGAGRRTYMRYTESMDVSIRRRATVSAALRKVLDRNELRLVFQPKLSLSQARITGVEALMRWTSPEHGEVSPAQFIPLAEESGLILELGEWALREACYTLRRWRQHGLDRLSMAVNVSSLQLLRGDLPQVVARVLEETGVPPECLELELTESVIMANAAQTSATLHAFRDLGVSLSIDDFGTGYSSLAYLKRLPINALKIDKEFIGDLTRDADDEAITSTVITMAHSLGLTVVAEGVEEEAQMQFLREHRCDEVQGYWLSPPLDAHRCLAFIRTWAPNLSAVPMA